MARITLTLVEAGEVRHRAIPACAGEPSSDDRARGHGPTAPRAVGVRCRRAGTPPRTVRFRLPGPAGHLLGLRLPSVPGGERESASPRRPIPPRSALRAGFRPSPRPIPPELSPRVPGNRVGRREGTLLPMQSIDRPWPVHRLPGWRITRPTRDHGRKSTAPGAYIPACAGEPPSWSRARATVRYGSRMTASYGWWFSSAPDTARSISRRTAGVTGTI